MRFGFVLVMAAFAFCLLFAGCAGAPNSQPPSYPIDSNVSTTLDRVVLPVPVPSTSPKLPPEAVSNFSQYGYGKWELSLIHI